MEKYALIGYPLGHSLSAIMHNYGFKKLNIMANYAPLELLPNELKYLRQYFKDLSGANVTIPYKEAIIPFLDVLDESAQTIGAVNTIVKRQNQLIGYNTDGYGFLQGLRAAQQLDKIHSKILVLGAGGAAKAVVATLINEGATDITIANRHMARQQNFASYPIKFYSFHDIDSLNEYDLIIQTTPLGMMNHSQDYPIDLTSISSNACCYDLVYNPLVTPFLKQVQLQGATTINGLPMLIFQGAKAFELWTGQSLPIDEIMTILQSKLKEN